MKIPLNLGGGGGSGSDDCTATASDVLESKTAIYNGSDDEAEYGTMKDYSGTTNAASAITQNGSNSRIELTVPNTGKYDTTSKIYYAYSSLASTIGLTAAKIATGNTILGITGTYTGLGSATAAQVLTGKTFSTASLSNATGTMTDKSGTTTSATASLDTSNSRVRMVVPATGYYNTSSYLYTSYSNMASTIGLTEDRLISGNSILGIIGTGLFCKHFDNCPVVYNGSLNFTTSEQTASQVGTLDVNAAYPVVLFVYLTSEFSLSGTWIDATYAWAVLDSASDGFACATLAPNNSTNTLYLRIESNVYSGPTYKINLIYYANSRANSVGITIREVAYANGGLYLNW